MGRQREEITLNQRRKRCANPACRRTYTYLPGEELCCPYCGKGSRRVGDSGRTAHWTEGMAPLGPCGGWYDVRVEGVGEKGLEGWLRRGIKPLKDVLQMDGGIPRCLFSAKAIYDRVSDGYPVELPGLSAEQVRRLTEDSCLSLRIRRVSRRKPADGLRAALERQQRAYGCRMIWQRPGPSGSPGACGDRREV